MRNAVTITIDRIIPAQIAPGSYVIVGYNRLMVHSWANAIALNLVLPLWFWAE